MPKSQDTAPAGATSPLDHVRAASERISAAADIVATVQQALEPDEADERHVSAYGALGQAHAMLRAADSSLDLAAIADQHRGAGEREGSDSLDALLTRLLEIVGHLQCADLVLFNLQDVPEPLQPAAIVLHRATQDLNRLHTLMDRWNTRHVSRPKTDADRAAVAAAYEAVMTPAERGRFRAANGLPAEGARS